VNALPTSTTRDSVNEAVPEYARQAVRIGGLAIGFWHPFGAHAGESRDAIVVRKRAEIEANGWTRWSFQHRKSLDAWRGLLPTSAAVFVLCSDSPSSRSEDGSETSALLSFLTIRNSLLVRNLCARRRGLADPRLDLGQQDATAIVDGWDKVVGTRRCRRLSFSRLPARCGYPPAALARPRG
jgi:hypothetical protein